MKTSIVTLRNAADKALHCILHEPDVPRAGLACVLLSPGVKMRVAPHRLYRKLVPEFLAQGIPVLRVDFHGLGDAEGELPEDQLDQLYRQVQLGRHVTDVLAATKWLTENLATKRFIVGGLCGGALTGLLASQQEPRIDGLYALGIPVILDASGAAQSEVMTEGQLTNLRAIYLRKLFDPVSWKRFFAARSDYLAIFRSMALALGFRLRGSGAKLNVDRVPAPATPPAANLNQLFVRAMFGLLGRGHPALLVFSGADRLHWEYEEKFARPWSKPLEKFRQQLDLEVIPVANHVLGDPAWVGRARELTREWLKARFP